MRLAVVTMLFGGLFTGGALAGEPREMAFADMPQALQRVHAGCASSEDTVFFSSESFGKTVVFLISCPLERAVSWPDPLTPRYDLDVPASFPVGVYVARDAEGRDARRVVFPILADDGSRTKVTTLPVSAEALHDATVSKKTGPPWIEALWKPDQRPQICKIMASWRIVDGEAELRRWRVAPKCNKDGPQYETRFSRKMPRLVVD